MQDRVERLDSPMAQPSASSAGSRADHQQRLTQAQQQQRELEKRIAHAQETKRVNPHLLDVWRREVVRWKNVEQAAARALRGLD